MFLLIESEARLAAMRLVANVERVIVARENESESLQEAILAVDVELIKSDCFP